MASTFDPNAFLETTFKGGLDTTYVLPDEGDYLAQITDKMEVRSGLIGPDKQNAGQPWLNVGILWEIMSDEQRSKLNTDKVFARQSLMIDLDAAGNPDFGTNKNMRLKRLLEATGLNKSKQWNLASLKFQTGCITVKHVQREGMDDPMAEVTRVTDAAKAPQGV